MKKRIRKFPIFFCFQRRRGWFQEIDLYFEFFPVKVKIESCNPCIILKKYNPSLHFINAALIFNKWLSEFVAAYRKSYSSSHIYMRLVENWKKELDNKKYVGAILMDLFKAFHCIPHELLIAKLDACGFSKNSLIFFFSYLKRRKQSIQINNTCSIFQLLLSGVPQSSILGPILFNLFINKLLMYIKNYDLQNFADGNTTFYVSS